MSYSEEEIEKYLNILESYKDTFNNTYLISQDTIPLKTPEKVSCHNCGNTHLTKYNGYSYCNKCFHSIGHILGYNEITESDRCCFHQKSIYKRDYHYQTKIEEINKKCNLKMPSDEKYELVLKLGKIDNKVMKKINEKWKRKRLINITYLIKKMLSEYDNSKAKKIKLNLSEKILNFYNDWYDDFKKIES